MVNHEYYFGALKRRRPGRAARGLEAPQGARGLLRQATRPGSPTSGPSPPCPGSAGRILFQDPGTGWLSNQWVTLHENGIPAGFAPIVVMDGWEHAFMRDYKAFERAKYVDAFFKNIDWEASEKRLK